MKITVFVTGMELPVILVSLFLVEIVTGPGPRQLRDHAPNALKSTDKVISALSFMHPLLAFFCFEFQSVIRLCIFFSHKLFFFC